jgi:hypothetical protein
VTLLYTSWDSVRKIKSRRLYWNYYATEGGLLRISLGKRLLETERKKGRKILK